MVGSFEMHDLGESVSGFRPMAAESALGAAHAQEDVNARVNKSRSKQLEPWVTGGRYAAYAGIGAVSGMRMFAEDTTNLQETGLGIGGAIAGSIIIMHVIRRAEGKQLIDDYRQKIFSLSEEFERFEAEINDTCIPEGQELLLRQRREVADELVRYEKMLQKELMDREHMLAAIFSKSTQTSISALRQSSMMVQLVNPESVAATASGVSSGLAIGVGGMLALFFGSKELKKVSQIAKKLTNELEAVEAELEQTDVPLAKRVLEFRKLNLMKQQEANYVRGGRNLFIAASGALGTAASSETILNLIGIGAGAIFGTAITATGIGAVVAAGLAMIGGVGYYAHQNKDGITYYFSDKRLAFDEQRTECCLKSLGVKHQKIRDAIYEIEQSIENYEADESYRIEIDAVWEEIVRIRESDSANQKTLKRLHERHQRLIFECIENMIGRKISRKDHDWTLVISFNDQQEKVTEVSRKLVEVQLKRRCLSDTYEYKRYCKEFTPHENGEVVTMEELKEFEAEISNAAPKELDELRRLCIAQAGRVSSVVDPSLMYADVPSQQKWRGVMAMITAKIG